MFLDIVLCTLLQGQVNNDPGCIGIKVDKARVTKVYENSPAAKVGIVKKDNILNISDENGNPTNLEGTVGETIIIKIKRRECIFTFKPWKSCPNCNGSNDADVIKIFVVKREPCNFGN